MVPCCSRTSGTCPAEHVLPMIPSGATYKDVIVEGRDTLEARAGL